MLAVAERAGCQSAVMVMQYVLAGAAACKLHALLPTDVHSLPAWLGVRCWPCQLELAAGSCFIY